MTPERWGRIDDLFNVALRLDPAEREAWLRDTKGGEGDLRREVGRLLEQHNRAEAEGFMTPPRRRPKSVRSRQRAGTRAARADRRKRMSPSTGVAPTSLKAAGCPAGP